MFGRSTKKPAKPSSVTVSSRKAMEPSVIANNMKVLGNIVSDGVLDIDGQVDGNVTAHLVTVRPSGRIRGDLIAQEVFVHGTVDGLIKAGNVNLYSTAQVNGTVMHESLMVEDGASIDGKLKRTEPQITAEERLALQEPSLSTPSVSVLDANFDNDNDQPQSEKEIKILENLRLIS